MNTRVQVEHAVTEMATGIDIVHEQIRIAAGEPLSFAQEDVVIRGSSIECRINAEAAHKKFAPAPGAITALPRAGRARACGSTRASRRARRSRPLYDPMIAKLIVADADREAATARMLRALDEFEIGGLTTLIPFHKALLRSEQWQQRRDLPRPGRGPEVAEVARARGRPPRRPRARRRRRSSSATTRSR